MADNFDMKQFLMENKLGAYSKLKETTESGLTPLQQYIYDYEVEISGDDFANEELKNIKKLNNIDDVQEYYTNYRGWMDDKDLRYELIDLIKDIARKFKAKKLAKEDMGHDIEDAEAEREMDFLDEKDI